MIPGVEAGILKIFYDEERDRLTVVERTEDGEVLGSHVRAEHSFFLGTEDVDQELEDELAKSRHLKRLSYEGRWVRAVWESKLHCEAVAEFLLKGGVEDPELELMLEQQLELEPEAQSYRKVKKVIRARIEAEHADLIAEDGVDSG